MAQYVPLGCTFNSPCYDMRNCYFCDKYGCNDKTIVIPKHVLCYVCGDDTSCLRIRRTQVMHLRFCYNTECHWAKSGMKQQRGCGQGDTAAWETVRNCDSDACNQFPTTGICYGCRENSRDCIYSQQHMNLIACPPGEESCFTNDRGMGRVERGCGTRTGEGAFNCHNSSLCNEDSTVTHACHIFQTDFDFQINMKPPVVGTQFAMGWTPDTCTDVDGRPACYMSYHKDGMIWGCIGDLKYYKENYYGADPSDTFLPCEGHYCNFLP